MNQKCANAARRVRRATAALLVSVLPACYQHVPVSLDSVQPSERVRVSLSPAAADEIHEVVGFRQTTVTARIASRSTNGVSLLIPSAYQVEGVRSRDLFQQVQLAPTDILGVQRVQLNRGRTALAAASAALVAGAILLNIFTGEAGSTGLEPSVPSAEIRLPL